MAIKYDDLTVGKLLRYLQKNLKEGEYLTENSKIIISTLHPPKDITVKDCDLTLVGSIEIIENDLGDYTAEKRDGTLHLIIDLEEDNGHK